MLSLDYYGIQVGSERVRFQIAPFEEGGKSYCYHCAKEVKPEIHLAARGMTAEYVCPICTWRTVRDKTKVEGEVDRFVYRDGNIFFRKELRIVRRDGRIPEATLPILQSKFGWSVVNKLDGPYLVKFYTCPTNLGIDALATVMGLATTEERVIEDAVIDFSKISVDKIFTTKERVTYFRGHERNVPTEIPKGWHLIGRKNRPGRQCTVLYAKAGTDIDVLFESLKKVISTRSESIEMDDGKIVIKSTHAARWHEGESGLREGLKQVLGDKISIVPVPRIDKQRVDASDVENIIDAEKKKGKMTREEVAALRREKAELERLESAERLRKSISKIKKRARS